MRYPHNSGENTLKKEIIHMANNNNTRPYLTAAVGMTVKGKPYAIQLEGYVASAAPYFKEASGDKKAFLSVSIGLRGSAARLMARADGTYDKDKEYGTKDSDGLEIDEFADLHIFGKTAEEMSKALVKGRRVVVSGPMKMETYKKKDETEGQRLVIDVNNIIDGGSRKNGIAPTVGNEIAVVTTTYTSKDGIVHNTPMACGVSGTVINCDGLKTSESEVSYLGFGMKTNMPAEKICDLANGTYSKDKTYDEKKTIVNVTLFGKQAERLASVIADGAVLVISGRVEAHEYNEKTSYRMRARDLTVLKYADNGGAAAAGTSAPSEPETSSGPSEFETFTDDDGELPF